MCMYVYINICSHSYTKTYAHAHTSCYVCIYVCSFMYASAHFMHVNERIQPWDTPDPRLQGHTYAHAHVFMCASVSKHACNTFAHVHILILIAL